MSQIHSTFLSRSVQDPDNNQFFPPFLNPKQQISCSCTVSSKPINKPIKPIKKISTDLKLTIRVHLLLKLEQSWAQFFLPTRPAHEISLMHFISKAPGFKCIIAQTAETKQKRISQNWQKQMKSV